MMQKIAIQNYAFCLSCSRFLLFICVVASIVLAGCGGGSNGGGTNISGSIVPGGGQAAFFVRSTPSPDMAAMRLDVGSVSLNDSTGKVNVISSSSQRIEMRHLGLASTLGFVGSVPAGDYANVAVTLGNQQLQFVDAAGNLITLDSSSTPSFRLAKTSVTIPATFSLASNGKTGVLLNLDVPKSLSVDSSGNYVLDPVFTSSQTADTDPENQLTSSAGEVTAIGTGSFDMRLFDSNQTIHVITDSNTIIDSSIGGFSALRTAQLLEIEARYQSDGNFLAKAISSSAPSQSARLNGTVISVAGNKTSLVVAPLN
jgi:hypothetical protein